MPVICRNWRREEVVASFQGLPKISRNEKRGEVAARKRR
jgi:hypothetical protein